jgi:anaerobic ribonucleoside-triphosphate reductase
MKSLFCLLVFFLCSATAFGQNNSGKSADNQQLKFPQFNGLKPRIEIPKALKIMKKFIKKTKIDTSNYYLSRVNLIQYSAKDGRQIVWYFRWVKTDGAVGDYIEITVFMDGSVRRLPPL